MSWQLIESPELAAIENLRRRISSLNSTDDLALAHDLGNRTLSWGASQAGEEPCAAAVFEIDGSDARLLFLGVAPEKTRRGVGGFLLDAALKKLAERGCSRVQAVVGHETPIFLSMLFKRGFRLAKVEADPERGRFQMTLYQELRPRRELRLALTERCNFRCIFCHNEGLGREKRPKIDPERVCDILCEALRLGYTDITFTGGEPLLEKERLIFLLKKLGRLSSPPDITLVTNGSLLGPAVIEALRDYPGKRKLHISFHASTPEIFRKITGVQNVGLYERIKNHIRRATEEGIPVKLNHVVLRGLNHDRILETVELARSLGATAVKFLELLVLPENPQDYEYFIDIDSLLPKIAEIAEGPDKRNLRQRVFRHRQDSRFLIEMQRLTCSIGCSHCRETRDRTLSSDLRLHPCFIRHKHSYPILSAASLSGVIEIGDRIIDAYAATYGDSSPTLVQKEVFVTSRTEFFYSLDSAADFRDFLRSQGFRLTAKVAFEEEYYRPRLFSSEWAKGERVLKIGWDHHAPGKIDLVYTDHSHTDVPGCGLKTETRYLDPSGPIRFPDGEKARRFLDRLDFQLFLKLEWDIETWLRDGLEMNLGVTGGYPTVKISGSEEDARRLLEAVGGYMGKFAPLQQPLVVHLCEKFDKEIFQKSHSPECFANNPSSPQVAECFS